MPGLLLGDQEWSHPLIAKPKSGLSRRYLLGLSGGALAFASFGSALAQSTPAASTDISGDDDAVTLLKQAVQAMADLETFHFLIETTSGETKLMDILTIDSVEGDVRRPYDFLTTVKASLFMGSITLSAIGLDGKISVQDPTSTTGDWIDLGGDASTLSMLNPDVLFLQAVGLLHNAALEGEEDFDGTPAQKVTGTVTLGDSLDFGGGAEASAESALATDPVDVTVWIDAESRILGAEFVGAVLAAEAANVTRLVTFSAFNEPVTIEKPEN
jgi:hypothetical protein